MASRRRADAQNTILVGLAFGLPSLALAIAAWVGEYTLFTALLVPLVLFGGGVTWLGTFDWLVSRGSEIAKATD